MKTKRISRILWTLALVAALGVFAFALYQLIPKLMAYRAAETEYASLADIAYAREGNPPESGTDGGPIDFAALSALNPDITGWIVVDGTGIDYPVVQGEDNHAYLHTTYSGEQNAAGAIFLDFNCDPDFSDRNSIIYGHMMKDGSMFAGLAKYKDQAFYEQHPTFTLYTPDAEYTCEVFAAYITPSSSETYTLGFASDADFAEYLGFAASNSLIQAGIIPTASDRIVTLSTCDYTYEDARMVVHARFR